jgi:hypothetical protein
LHVCLDLGGDINKARRQSLGVSSAQSELLTNSNVPSFIKFYSMAKSKPKPTLKDHAKQGQLPIRANAVYVGAESLNIYLTYDQAIQVATNILKKAELIKCEEDKVVQLWTMKGSDKVNFGIIDIVQKGAREAWE